MQLKQVYLKSSHCPVVFTLTIMWWHSKITKAHVFMLPYFYGGKCYLEPNALWTLSVVRCVSGKQISNCSADGSVVRSWLQFPIQVTVPCKDTRCSKIEKTSHKGFSPQHFGRIYSIKSKNKEQINGSHFTWTHKINGLKQEASSQLRPHQERQGDCWPP